MTTTMATTTTTTVTTMKATTTATQEWQPQGPHLWGQVLANVPVLSDT